MSSRCRACCLVLYMSRSFWSMSQDDLEAPTASLLYANLEDGVLRLSGSASDIGGVVASVEVSWSHGRWHLAELDRLASEVKWSLAWGHEEWHALHGGRRAATTPSSCALLTTRGTRGRYGGRGIGTVGVNSSVLM